MAWTLILETCAKTLGIDMLSSLICKEDEAAYGASVKIRSVLVSHSQTTFPVFPCRGGKKGLVT